MSKIFFALLFLLLFISCDNDKGTSEPVITKDTTIVQPTVSENLLKVTYVSATYYTGRVDFYFTDEIGEKITVGISNFPEDKGAVYPKSLLESTDTTEGPPAENPAMVGKEFFLVKNAAGELTEIRSAK